MPRMGMRLDLKLGCGSLGRRRFWGIDGSLGRWRLWGIDGLIVVSGGSPCFSWGSLGSYLGCDSLGRWRLWGINGLILFSGGGPCFSWSMH